MKKFIFLFLILFLSLLSCEYLQEILYIHELKYKVDSEKLVDLQIIYKAESEYLTETITTPFEYTQEINLEEYEDCAYEFYLQVKFINLSEYDDKISGYVYLNGNLIDSFHNDPEQPGNILIAAGTIQQEYRIK